LHKSKLQVCVEVLCCLSSNGPLKLREISREVELDKSVLLGYLGFLYDRGLVGEQNLDEDEFWNKERKETEEEVEAL